MKHTNTLFSISCALLTSACVASFDMQGQDPRDYYAKHPVENKVETRYLTQLIHFTKGHKLDRTQLNTLSSQVNQISPLAVDHVEVQLHPSHAKDRAMQQQIMRSLRRAGIPSKNMTFTSMDEVGRHDANVQIAYASVVSPRCPDWRPSPVTSYANMTYTPNIGCATHTNLGLMLADPRDLVSGEGDGTPDTSNTTRAVQQYREGDGAASEGGAADGGAPPMGLQ